MCFRFPSSLRFLGLAAALGAAASASPLLRAADMEAIPVVVPTVTAAVAVLIPTDGNVVHGEIHFTKVAGGVRVVAQVSGLKPGVHGFHIHEFGDASTSDGAGAGGHFNPTHEAHGAPTAEHHHEGDLGNLTADDSGHATIDFVTPALSFEGAASIIGRGVVIHADADDLTSQPVGNAGKRVAVGAIGIAKS